MGGIFAIQNRVEERSNPQLSQSGGQEIFFKDGDQAFLTPVASGEENDKLLDEVYLYTYRSGTRWINLLKDDDTDVNKSFVLYPNGMSFYLIVNKNLINFRYIEVMIVMY